MAFGGATKHDLCTHFSRGVFFIFRFAPLYVWYNQNYKTRLMLYVYFGIVVLYNIEMLFLCTLATSLISYLYLMLKSEMILQSVFFTSHNALVSLLVLGLTHDPCL